jgi:hypothetical protein
MKRSNVFCRWLLLSVGLCFFNYLNSKSKDVSVDQSVPLSQINSFHKKFLSWKKGLTLDQKKYFNELFGQYAVLYKNRKKNPSDQELIVIMQNNSLQNIMDNWQSFYEKYINASIFNKALQAWKETALKTKLIAAKTILEKYNQLFIAYDKNPKDIALWKQLLKQQEALKGLMS